MLRELMRLRGNLSLDPEVMQRLRNEERRKVLPEVVLYSIILCIGAVANFRALYQLLQRRHLQKPINQFMAHLTFADLLVILVTVPIEIGWRLTVSWEAGVVGCKVMQMVRGK